MALTLDGKAAYTGLKVLAKGTFLVKNAFSHLIPKRYKDLKTTFLSGLEILRDERGVFTAALSDDYDACWMRDQLYCNYAYLYLGDTKKLREGIRVVFDMLEASRSKIDNAICDTPQRTHDFIHAKFSNKTLGEITDDWGHHQIDAIGLFLFMVGNIEKKGIRVVETKEDREMLQLLVGYLISVRYWEMPDNGMWEEWQELHSSSIGAAVAGLSLIKEQKLAVVAESLIQNGKNALDELLPNETPMRGFDLAQLSLVWPLKVVSEEMAGRILTNVTENLVQSKGLNRYIDDNYYRSDNGISAEWTFGYFWLSIIFSKMGEKYDAEYWFRHGVNTLTPEGLLPELYQNGEPNKNTPLGWSHSLALIAQKKLKHATTASQ